MSSTATCASPDPSFHRLLSCLGQIRSKLDNKQDADLLFLYEYFRQPEFKDHGSVLSTGRTISETNSNGGIPLAQQVCDVLVLYSDTNEEARELQELLSSPHFKGLLQAHDDVVNGQFVNKEGVDNQEDMYVIEEGDPLNEHMAREGGFSYEEEKLWNQNLMAVQIKRELWDSQAQENGGFSELDEISQTVCDPEEFCDEGHLDRGEGVLPVTTFLKEPLNKVEGVPLVTPLDPEEGCTLLASIKEPLDSEEEFSGQSSFPTNETASCSQVEVREGKSLDSGDNVDHGSSSTIKVLQLKKSDSQPLGLTVRSDEDRCAIVVARILHGGTADKSGSLKVGDEIMEINDENVAGLSTDEVVDIIDRVSGSVSLKVASPVAEGPPQIKYEMDKVYMRALFDFDPMRDALIPCKEAGVPFQKGDMLQVVSQEDLNWWQARRADDPNGEVGLIPSKEFMQTRQAFDRRVSGSTSPSADDRNIDTAADEGKLISPYAKWKRRKSASTKGAKSRAKSGKAAKKGEALTYEEVTLYRAGQNKKRPVLLIGPSGVGRTELKRMILMNDPDAFVATVPHTSRPMQPYETDGKDYHFVSRHTMERFIQDNKFIEVGEYKGCLYGTSKDSIKRAMKTGKMCVIKVHEEVLHCLRTADFMPFCVFVKPPSLGRLRSTRHIATKANSSANRKAERSFKEEDLQKMISAAELIERDYGHLFDLTVVNDDLQETFELLLAALNRVANEQQWVPVSWLQSQ